MGGQVKVVVYLLTAIANTNVHFLEVLRQSLLTIYLGNPEILVGKNKRYTPFR